MIQRMRPEPAVTALDRVARSVAGTVVSFQEPYATTRLDESAATLDLQPFERGRRSLLAAAAAVQ